MAAKWSPRQLEVVVILVLQLVLLLVLGLCTTYQTGEATEHVTPDAEMAKYYPLFQDVHVMMFAGFGFLMTFLRRYGYSSVGFNFLLAALLLQWSILCKGFYDKDPRDGSIHIGIINLLQADLTVATILISMGAVLGKVTPLQLVVMGFIETAICTANEHLGVSVLKAVDAGGSMYVHVFGAYFGLAASLVLGHGRALRKNSAELEGASYNSDLFAMVATIFLWCFWPSFNGALSSGDEQVRAVVNTYLALAASAVTTFAVSALSTRDAKFSMVHVQNATLAGGVAVGSGCDMLLRPAGAVAVGVVAGIISTLAYRYLQPWLLRRVGLHDTCGVHCLHGLPGVLAGIAAAIAAGLASEQSYGPALYKIFPARALQPHEGPDGSPSALLGRSAQAQAGFQLLALAHSLAIALVAGALTGVLLRLPVLQQVPREEWFSDGRHWELPEEGWESPSRAANGDCAATNVVAPSGEQGLDNLALEAGDKVEVTALESQLHI
ncbi:ammonium transporter Rh type B [Schistocerca nitens]|uniref:ammonium transporter Rh type B n=1 Tax=Schistocerca nitens TaxID=7011 RepID=UPI002117D758|nr:ammonium transporter Rh type B [Schistocerca nitens]XP_049795389.1 ammonium transporter Rh type B [Schistocerca nitens]